MIMSSQIDRVCHVAKRLSLAAVLPLALWAVSATAGMTQATAIEQDQPDKKDAQPPKDKLGLLLNDPRAFQGYTLFSPQNSTKTFLIDMQGRVVRMWTGAGNPGHTSYLLQNGNMLRACEAKGKDLQFVGGGEIG